MNELDKRYWEGVLDTCLYFQDIGIEDAMQTDSALEAIRYLSITTN